MPRFAVEQGDGPEMKYRGVANGRCAGISDTFQCLEIVTLMPWVSLRLLPTISLSFTRNEASGAQNWFLSSRRGKRISEQPGPRARIACCCFFDPYHWQIGFFPLYGLAFGTGVP